MSRTVRFHSVGGPEVLSIEDISIPLPAAGEVRIQVKAIGLNRAESMFRSGAYVVGPKFPSGLGYEAAGSVEKVGPGVDGFTVGDAVSVVPAFSMNDYAMYGELVLAPATAVVKHPTSLSWTDAAATWMMFTTAYGALVEIADVQAGDAVLIPAASSSTGLAAIQIVNMLGGVSIAVTRTASKRDELIKAGAAHVVVSNNQDIAAEVFRITSGLGARVVFDPVGGKTFSKLAASTARGGMIFIYGALDALETQLPVLEVLGRHLTIRGYELFEITETPERLADAKRFIVKGLASGELKPVISKIFRFDQIVEAHRYLESNAQIGKVVVTL